MPQNATVASGLTSQACQNLTVEESAGRAGRAAGQTRDAEERAKVALRQRQLQPKPNRQSTRRAATDPEPDQLVIEFAWLQSAQLPAHDRGLMPVRPREAPDKDRDKNRQAPAAHD